MIPEISYFITSSLVETDKYIEVADGNFITEKQTEMVEITCVMTMTNPSLLRYRTCYWHHTRAIDCFTLLG